MSTKSLAHHILVIDDGPQIRRFLEITLRSQGFVVALAATGQEGITQLAAHGADLVVLDLELPDLEGHEVLREIRGWSQVPVIVLSVRASETEKVRALDGGANDYVVKPFGAQELMARVRAAIRDHATPDEGPPIFDDGYLHVDLARRMVHVAGQPQHLTPKEYDVLAALVRHPGRVVTQQQLLRELWGPAHLHDTHYLRIVVARIRQKIGDRHDVPRYLVTESGIGYRFVGEGRPASGNDPA